MAAELGTTLSTGTLVQYRRVGIARLCENRGEGCWTVQWIKAPKRYRESNPADVYYFFAHDVLADCWACGASAEQCVTGGRCCNGHDHTGGPR